jgi:hypothetical protein
MFAVDVCRLPATGGSTFVVAAGLFLLIAGVIVTRWVRQSAGRMSVVVAPLVLLGGFVLAPSVTDPCSPTTTVAPTTTPVATTTTTVATTTTTIVAVSTSTTVALTCATGGSCAVGDTGPGGGIVFYVDLTREPVAQYLEAACAGWQNNCDGTTADPEAEWGCYGTVISGADGLVIGTGELNTTDILAGCLTAGIAADLADSYSHNSLDDWFLPSLDELIQMYIERTAIGGFSTGYYLSSSEADFDVAWFLNFYDNIQTNGPKHGETYVRPVRAF